MIVQVTMIELVQAWVNTQEAGLIVVPQKPKLIFERKGLFGKNIAGIQMEVRIEK
jgi:hypothetical protein